MKPPDAKSNGDVMAIAEEIVNAHVTDKPYSGLHEAAPWNETRNNLITAIAAAIHAEREKARGLVDKITEIAENIDTETKAAFWVQKQLYQAIDKFNGASND